MFTRAQTYQYTRTSVRTHKCIHTCVRKINIFPHMYERNQYSYRYEQNIKNNALTQPRITRQLCRKDPKFCNYLPSHIHNLMLNLNSKFTCKILIHKIHRNDQNN